MRLYKDELRNGCDGTPAGHLNDQRRWVGAGWASLLTSSPPPVCDEPKKPWSEVSHETKVCQLWDFHHAQKIDETIPIHNWVNFHHELSSGKKIGIFPLIEFLGKSYQIWLQTRWSNYHPDSQRNWSWVLMGASRLGLRPRYIPLGTIVNGEHLVGRNIKWFFSYTQKLLILSYIPSRKSPGTTCLWHNFPGWILQASNRY